MRMSDRERKRRDLRVAVYRYFAAKRRKDEILKAKRRKQIILSLVYFNWRYVYSDICYM